MWPFYHHGWLYRMSPFILIGTLGGTNGGKSLSDPTWAAFSDF